MVDVSVAVAWLAISAASVKGLLVFAHATVTSDPEGELDVSPHLIDMHANPLASAHESVT